MKSGGFYQEKEWYNSKPEEKKTVRNISEFVGSFSICRWETGEQRILHVVAR